MTTAKVKGPVCGMDVDSQRAAGGHEHRGRTYYFCSKHCLTAFKANPAKYAGQEKAAPPPAAPAGARYTCPMHPEIVKAAPGDCPLCGMAPRARGWLELALGTPVVLWVGWPILRKFWLSLAHWALNMYTLIGLGVALAYLFSLAAVLAPDLFPSAFREHDGAVGTYFEAAAVIVTLVILGDVLQLRAMGQTSQG